MYIPGRSLPLVGFLGSLSRFDGGMEVGAGGRRLLVLFWAAIGAVMVDNSSLLGAALPPLFFFS